MFVLWTSLFFLDRWWGKGKEGQREKRTRKCWKQQQRANSETKRLSENAQIVRSSVWFSSVFFYFTYSTSDKLLMDRDFFFFSKQSCWNHSCKSTVCLCILVQNALPKSTEWRNRHFFFQLYSLKYRTVPELWLVQKCLF